MLNVKLHSLQKHEATVESFSAVSSRSICSSCSCQVGLYRISGISRAADFPVARDKLVSPPPLLLLSPSVWTSQASASAVDQPAVVPVSHAIPGPTQTGSFHIWWLYLLATGFIPATLRQQI